jgi:membrane protein DedA with SNARE-associated domain
LNGYRTNATSKEPMTDWIFTVIDRLGPAGVGVLVLLENLIPPVPSEVVLPLAGFRARTGVMNPVVVWAAATAGSLLGALLLYGLGAWFGYDRLHRLTEQRWFLLASPADLERGRRLFDRHGAWIVVTARCVPVLRSLISLPAGVAGMPLPRFVALTTAGTGVWNAVFVTVGWLLADNWDRVGTYTRPAGIAMTIGIGLAVAFLAGRKLRGHSRGTH